MIYYSVNDKPEGPWIYVHRCVYTLAGEGESASYAASTKVKLEWASYECTNVATCDSLKAAHKLMYLLRQESMAGLGEA